MSDYQTYPAVDSFKNFPPSVRAALAAAGEMLSRFAHLDANNKLVISGEPVGEPSPVASLDTVGWARAVFIANGATYPSDAGPYTIVIESE